MVLLDCIYMFQLNLFYELIPYYESTTFRALGVFKAKNERLFCVDPYPIH